VPERAPRAWPWFAAVLVGASLFWALDLAVLRAGVPSPLDDLWEYGVTARHLLAGHGYRTSVIHPPIWGLRDGALSVPVLMHGPALPLVLAPLIAVLGPTVLDQAAWLAALFALLTALLIARAGARVFGPAVGAAAALLFTLSPLTLNAVHHDMSLTVGAFLLLLAFDRLAREEPRTISAAFVLGLGALVRPEMVLALAGLSLLAGGPGTAFLILGVAVVSAPWWWHCWRAAGSPFFGLSSYLLLGYSDRWPGLTELRDFTLTPSRWLRTLAEHHGLVPAKAVEHLPHALKRALLSPSGSTGWLAAAGFLVALARRSTRWIAFAALLIALVPIAVMTLAVYDTRYLVPFLPLWALAAAVAAEWLWGRIPRVGRTRLWVVALALLMLPAAVPTLVRATREARRFEAHLRRERAGLAPLTAAAAAPARLTIRGLEQPVPDAPGPPRLLFSDAAGFVAWTTGRPTLWMTADEFGRLAAPAGGPGTGAVRAWPLPAASIAEREAPPAQGPPGDTWFHEGLR
jgi:hypothetical protein